ncbi:tetratricopeptide repeat protein [Hymenobacter sp. BT175]|uniref:toxin-antitoxin system YwqK family antitoxin n=1 Tax=Hymenobacter translucens TaxID=2886507 RepID=UPI001D0E765E|nr:toxin-antitoxin system YwqK family antitoxin [Hymenobacter translucens]MCC2548384.1 tetratricopeptide repeat protein [Hymenobacter translucens]
MRILTHGSLLILLVASGHGAFCQTSTSTLPRLVNSGQVLKEGVELHDKGEYAAAIARYRTVTPGDTSYARIQGELGLSYLEAKQYKEAIAATQQAIALKNYDPQVYNVQASAYDELGNAEQALKVYAEALKRFPYSQSLWFNQGVTLSRADRTLEAQASLQRSLELKPTHAGTHLMLGSLAMRQGQTSHALISLLTFLAIEPNSGRSRNQLVMAEQLSSNSLVIEEKEKLKPVTPNEVFSELDLLINSKIALRKDYTSKVKFDANVVKQAQLLVEKFPTGAPESDFWLRAYGPMVEALRRDDNLTAFTYLALSSAQDEKAAKWVKGNKKLVSKMGDAVAEALLTLREKQPVVRGGKTTLVKAWFNDEGQLNGLGEGESSEKETRLEGPWYFVNSDGAVTSEGTFSGLNQRQGMWRSYHTNGTLEKEQTFNSDGKLEGPYKEYHDNGAISIEATYQDGKANGPVKLYFYCGLLREIRPFKDDMVEGELSLYYTDGKKQSQVSMKADKKDGVGTDFFPDGTVESQYHYADGLKHGPFVENFPGGKVSRKGSHDKGELDGQWDDYAENGQLLQTGTYSHGKRTGPWKDYYRTGKLSAEKTYDATGELTGTYRDYDEDGKLYMELTYDQGRVLNITYLDKAGKKISSTAVAKKGRTAVQGLRPDGTTRSSGTYVNGKMDGEWRWTYPGGTPETVRHFVDGTQQGAVEQYWPTGKLQSREQYADDQQNGYYEAFRLDGQLRQTGFFQKGVRQGQWHDYYADGRLSEEYDYQQGELNGLARSFTPTGKLSQERLYNYGRILGITTYDSTGKVLSKVDLGPATKEYTLVYPNGKPLFRAAMSCYEEQGASTWYTPGGKPEIAFEQVRGQRSGPFKSWNPVSGKMSSEGQYRDGRPDGEWKFYYPSGALSTRGSYRNGSREGNWTEYFENGKVESVRSYQDDELDGITLLYNMLGELLVEKTYRKGMVVSYRGPGADGKPAGEQQILRNWSGTVKTLFANGKPALEEVYVNGYFDKTRTYYYSTGQVYRRGTNVAGVISGPYFTYYPNGKPQEEENYLHDERHGRCRYYRADGTLEREETYRAGERSGPAVYYDAQGKPLKTNTYWNAFVYDGK